MLREPWARGLTETQPPTLRRLLCWESDGVQTALTPKHFNVPSFNTDISALETKPRPSLESAAVQGAGTAFWDAAGVYRGLEKAM